jgi:hypothetical protein
MTTSLSFFTDTGVWREHINHNRWCMTTDLFGWAGPAATINRVSWRPEWLWEIRIADRNGDIILRLHTDSDEEGAKAMAYEALLDACRS